MKNQDNYYESNEFNRVIKIISRYKKIDQEALSYRTKIIDGLSPENFSKVCHSIFETLEDKIVEEKDSSFGKYHVDYNNIRFHLLIGQGSVFWTEKLKK